MTKPENIGQDIWDKAFEALHPSVRDHYETSPFAMVQHLGIARAILSAVEEENEACAKIADSYIDTLDAAHHIRRRVQRSA